MKHFGLYTILSFVVFTTLNSCSDDKETYYPDIEKLITAARSIDYYAVDSLAKYGLKYEDTEDYRAQLAIALLEKSIIDMDHSHNDSLIQEAEKYYIKHNTREKYAKLQFFKGLEYHENGLFKKASQCISEGIEIAKRCGYHKTLGDLYKYKAAFLDYQNDDYKELKHYDLLSLKEYKLAKDTIGIVSAYGNLYSSHSYLTNDYKAAMAYLDTADAYCKKVNLTNRKADIDIKRMYCFIELDSLEKAESMFFDSITVTPFEIKPYYTVGCALYKQKNDYDKVIELYKELYNHTDISDDILREYCYKYIGETYYELQDYENSARYLKEGYDRLTASYRKYTVNSSKITSKVYDNELLEQKIKAKDTMNMLIISICMLIFSVFITVIIRIRYQKQKDLFDANQRINKISKEMGQKLDELETELTEVKESKSQVQDAAKELLSKRLSLIEKINMKEVTSDVNKIYDNYADKVNKIDMLSDKDKQFCILYKAGIQPKVIALLMDCSASRIYTRKAEINSKLKSTDVNFDLFDESN